jgi:hypothetical protein
MAAPEPTLARKFFATLAVALIVAVVWWVIQWRTAPPIPGL